VLFENRKPTFARSLFDLVALTDPSLGLTAWRAEVIGREVVIDVAGERWTETATVQELPAVVDFFDVGTDAIGGAAILAR
jgi:hypothetical protein